MNTKIGVSGIVVALLLACRVSAGEPPSAIAEAYLKGLVSGDAAAAYDTLMTHSRVDEVKPREIALAKSRVVEGIALLGKPTAWESVASKAYAPSITRLIYITKHADMPLVWNFFFYRAADDWQLVNFDFNDQLMKLD